MNHGGSLDGRSKEGRPHTFVMDCPPITRHQGTQHGISSDIFICALVSCVAVSSLHLRTLPQGPRVSSKTVFFTFVITSGRTDCPLRTQPTLIAELSYCSFRQSTIRSSCAPHSRGKRLPVSGSDRRKNIFLRPSGPSLFNFIVVPWQPLQFLQYFTCMMLLGIMLKRVQADMSSMETQQVSMNGNSAHGYALLVNPVINTSNRCPRSVTDCVATHSSRHTTLASTICAKLSTEDHVLLTR